MPSGHADSTGFSSVGTSLSGVLKTGDSLVDGDGGSGAGEEVRRVSVLEKGRRAVAGKRRGIGIRDMREVSAEARWRHRWQIMVCLCGGELLLAGDTI